MPHGTRTAGAPRTIRGSGVIAISLVAVLIGAIRLRAQSTGLRLATPERLGAAPKAFAPYVGKPLPPSVRLDPLFPYPGDQGSQRSCVGWAVAYALKSYQERVEEQWDLFSPTGAPEAARHFSPAFVYNQVNEGVDRGATFESALDLVVWRGAASLAAMPYDPADYKRQPSTAELREAARYRTNWWKVVSGFDTALLKSYLFDGYPILIGAIVDDGFVALRGDDPWREFRGAVRDAHAMVLVGYDDQRGAFRLINSWGATWGDRGYAWLDYAHATRVIREAYVVYDGSNNAILASQLHSRIMQRASQPIADSAVTLRERDAVTLTATAVRSIAGAIGAGDALEFSGALTSTAGFRGTVRVVVQLYHATANGTRGDAIVGANAEYATSDGVAAAPSAKFELSGSGEARQWTARIPLSAIRIPEWLRAERIDLIAESTVYVNDFGLSRGPSLSFSQPLATLLPRP